MTISRKIIDQNEVVDLWRLDSNDFHENTKFFCYEKTPFPIQILLISAVSTMVFFSCENKGGRYNKYVV